MLCRSYSFCSSWMTLKHSSSLLPLSFVLRTLLSVEIKITFLSEHKSWERIPVMLPEEPAVLFLLFSLCSSPDGVKWCLQTTESQQVKLLVSKGLYNIPWNTQQRQSAAVRIAFCHSIKYSKKTDFSNKYFRV